jgi:hypothetical protein
MVSDEEVLERGSVRENTPTTTRRKSKMVLDEEVQDRAAREGLITSQVTISRQPSESKMSDEAAWQRFQPENTATTTRRRRRCPRTTAPSTAEVVSDEKAQHRFF